jgi:predicted nucleic acid-binding protein
MMKHYLVDTNVIIDMLLDREDANAACAVIDGAERGDYVLHICALSFTTMFYSLRKILTREQRIVSHHFSVRSFKI